MRILIWAVFFSMPVLAEDVGVISKDKHIINIIDTYSVFDVERNEITVHFLPCKYSEKLRLDWKEEYGFMKCFPVSSEEYFVAPGASLSIQLNDKGEMSRAVFSTTQMGDKESRGYQGFSKTWFRNPPIEWENSESKRSLRFSAFFEIPDKMLKVSLKINTVVNDVIELRCDSQDKIC